MPYLLKEMVQTQLIWAVWKIQILILWKIV